MDFGFLFLMTMVLATTLFAINSEVILPRVLPAFKKCAPCAVLALMAISGLIYTLYQIVESSAALSSEIYMAKQFMLVYCLLMIGIAFTQVAVNNFKRMHSA